LAQAQAAGSIPQQRGAIDIERFTSDAPAFEAGAAHAGAHPFDNQVAFQFGVLRRTAIRRLCGARDYAKPQHRGGTVACISVMWGFA